MASKNQYSYHQVKQVKDNENKLIRIQIKSYQKSFAVMEVNTTNNADLLVDGYSFIQTDSISPSHIDIDAIHPTG